MILQRVKNLLWYPPSERKGRPLGSYSRTFPWKTLYYRVSVHPCFIFSGIGTVRSTTPIKLAFTT